MAQLVSMLKVTCINRSVNMSNQGYRSIILHDMAGDEVEEGEEGEERLLSVLSMVSATITPSTIITSIRNHQQESAPALSDRHYWKAATTMQMSRCIRTRSIECIDRTMIALTTIPSHLEPCVNH